VATTLRRPFAPYTSSTASCRSFGTSPIRRREDSDDKTFDKAFDTAFDLGESSTQRREASDDKIFDLGEPSTQRREASDDKIFDLGESFTPRRKTSHDTGLNTTFDRRGDRTSPTRSRSPRTKSRTETRKPRTETKKENAPADQGEQPEKPTRETWQIQKAALKAKFPEGWNPRKRLSPDALIGIRALHQQFPDEYSTETLAEKFEVSPEAIRRILKSKWSPSAEEEISRQDRWYNRGKSVWERWAALGKKPPQRWRKDGVTRDPSWNEKGGRRSLASAQKKLARNLL